MARIPEKVNDFRVYVNGSPELKGVSDLQLPSLNPKTETVSGGGLMGEYDAPNFSHLESMKATINWRVINDELIEFLKPEVIKVDFRVANQELEGSKGKHEFGVNRIVIRGIPMNNDLGKVAKGSPYEGSSEIEVLYIKMEYNGKTLIEIDKLNYIYRVGDVDYMEKLRAALGM
ncbi:phage major tail tube protein [Lysinibacillus sphaericus]|uniref:phage major tail tube protein n=1 Tax=Lysinibacillus sphaericus TaxID=1421 RepID=UPI00055C91DC|nr:phage major tail tube protein [Lysinibacillus sphaericus]